MLYAVFYANTGTISTSAYNGGHNILELFNNLAQFWITLSKTVLDI